MATLPSARTGLDDQAGGFANATDFVVIAACVAQNADSTPRVYSSAKALLTQHLYSPGVDYAAHHIKDTGKQVILIGLPVATAGTLGRLNTTGVTGTSAFSVTAGSSGYMEETEGSITVVDGGTIGTDQITLDLSMDGGWTTKRVRLGTASTYTVPNLGQILNFGAGTLVAGDTASWSTTAPMWDVTGIDGAETALATQQKAARSWMVIGDLPNSTFAGYVRDAANTYETDAQRFVYARASVKDRTPLATMAKVTKRANLASQTLTFAEVGGTGDTITRSAGSWITDGLAVGDTITVAGSASNNVTGAIASLSATVITLGTTDLAAEAAVADCTVTASPTLTFAEVGATGDTVTRSSGSWLNDGFAVGDTVTFSGTASNNVTGAIASLSATVLTFNTTDLAAEVLRSDAVTCTKGQTMAAYVSAMDTAFAAIDDEPRVDLSLGRARKASPITGWSFRRPAAWPLSLREYQHDIHVPTFRKADGTLSGWDITDGAGQTVEYDERTDGGAIAGRFSCLRTWSNGPNGTFGAQSLTRASDASLLSRTHNMAVANLTCSVVQAETEYMIGQTPQLNSNGTIVDAALRKLEQRVNSKLQIALLSQGNEGARASSVKWTANRDDVINVPDATLNGVAELKENGTIEHVTTSVRVDQAG